MTRPQICFVCTGNICRSPVAEALLRQMAEGAGWSDRVDIISAGTLGLIGLPAEPLAVATARAHGVDLAGHRSRGVDDDVVAASALVLCMETAHAMMLRALYPEHAARVFLLSAFPEAHLEGEDVADPMGKDEAAFQATCATLARLLPGVAHEAARVLGFSASPPEASQRD